jgi:hypothetical protein
MLAIMNPFDEELRSEHARKRGVPRASALLTRPICFILGESRSSIRFGA